MSERLEPFISKSIDGKVPKHSSFHINNPVPIYYQWFYDLNILPKLNEENNNVFRTKKPNLLNFIPFLLPERLRWLALAAFSWGDCRPRLNFPQDKGFHWLRWTTSYSFDRGESHNPAIGTSCWCYWRLVCPWRCWDFQILFFLFGQLNFLLSSDILHCFIGSSGLYLKLKVDFLHKTAHTIWLPFELRCWSSV